MKLISISFILVLFDQITKNLAQNFFNSTPGTGNFFFDSIGFQYVRNYGVAFGIELPPYLIFALNLILLLLIIFFYKKEVDIKNIWNKFAMNLIISGAVGNLMDRLIFGYVIDFIALWSYPRFNLADVYISLGVLLTLVNYAKINRLNPKK